MGVSADLAVAEDVALADLVESVQVLERKLEVWGLHTKASEPTTWWACTASQTQPWQSSSGRGQLGAER